MEWCRIDRSLNYWSSRTNVGLHDFPRIVTTLQVRVIISYYLYLLFAWRRQTEVIYLYNRSGCSLVIVCFTVIMLPEKIYLKLLVSCREHSGTYGSLGCIPKSHL
ncbi:hypothetical protein KP509_1Z046100 [Ceratopteris richardii]|nr:hypothetical protein KP509_1Z046100 [Ceratopteris richardii]